MSHQGSLPPQTLGATGQRETPASIGEDAPFPKVREDLYKARESSLFLRVSSRDPALSLPRATAVGGLDAGAVGGVRAGAATAGHGHDRRRERGQGGGRVR